MSERYGPEDTGIPAWEAPAGNPVDQPARWSSPTTGPQQPQARYAPGAPGQSAIPTYRSWQPGFLPLRPMGLGDFLSLPMKGMTFNRSAVIGGPLLCVLVSLVFSAVALALFLTQEWEPLRQFFEIDYTYAAQSTINWNPLGWGAIAAILVTVVVAFVVDAFARTMIIPGIAQGVLGQRTTLKKAWASSVPRLPQVLLLYLLTLVASIVLLVVFALVVGLFALGGSGTAILGILLGYLLIGAGAMCMALLTGIALSVVVLERVTAVVAIRRTFTLLKKNFWRIFGSFLLVGVILYFVSGAITGVAEVILIVLLAASPSVGTVIIVSSIVLVVVFVVSSIFQYSFVGSLLTLMYIDLRIRAEGFDVDLARAAEAAARK
jgi:hypothetical protein